MITSNDTARILIEALPYIRRFTGKTIIVKVGGLPMTDPKRMRSLAKDILLLHSVGIRPVLVHGGGPQIDVEMAKAGIEVKRVEGLRVTDAEALDMADPETPVGARGVGEPPVGAGYGAVLNAIADAVGEDVFRRAPVTADIILMSLENGRRMHEPLRTHV